MVTVLGCPLLVVPQLSNGLGGGGGKAGFPGNNPLRRGCGDGCHGYHGWLM